MNVRRKFGAVAVIVGLIVAAAAAPASATVYNQPCYKNYPGVMIESGNHPPFCYAWDGGRYNNGNTGWANIDDATWACSGVNAGTIEFTDGRQVEFLPTSRNGCTWLDHNWVRYIHFVQ